MLLNQAARSKKANINSILCDAISTAEIEIGKFTDLVKSGRPETRGRGSRQGRVQIGTSLPLEYQSRLEKLADLGQILGGEALTACIYIHLDAGGQNDRELARLMEHEAIETVGAFPFEPGIVLNLPKTKANEELLKGGIFFLDSSILYGAFALGEEDDDRYRLAKNAVKRCLNGITRGVTTALDICEACELLLKADISKYWFENMPNPPKISLDDMLRQLVHRRMQLLAKSSITILTLDAVDLFESTTKTISPNIFVSARLLAVQRRWARERVIFLTLRDVYDSSDHEKVEVHKFSRKSRGK